jgi:hypothetical protein
MVPCSNSLAPCYGFASCSGLCPPARLSQQACESVLCRLAHAVAAQDSVRDTVEVNPDGSLTFHFGIELDETTLGVQHTDAQVLPSDAAGPSSSNGSASGVVNSSSNGSRLQNGNGSASEPVRMTLPLLPTVAPAGELPLEPQHGAPPSSAQLASLAAEAQQAVGGEGDEQGGNEGGEELPDVHRADYSAAQTGSLLRLYTSLCDAGKLDDALLFIRGCIRANRTEVLMR